jgi:hypothetical protein
MVILLYNLSFDLQEKIIQTRAPISTLAKKSAGNLKNFEEILLKILPENFLAPEVREKILEAGTRAVEEKILDLKKPAEIFPEFFSQSNNSEPEKKEESEGGTKKGRKKEGGEGKGEGPEGGKRSDKQEEEGRRGRRDKEEGSRPSRRAKDSGPKPDSEKAEILNFLNLSRDHVSKLLHNSARSGTAFTKLGIFLTVAINGVLENFWILRQVLHRGTSWRDFWGEERRASPSPSTSPAGSQPSSV